VTAFDERAEKTHDNSTGQGGDFCYLVGGPSR